MAIDFQGPELPRPYVETANATFTTVVDADNQLGDLFGFRAIPNGVFVDESGVIRYAKYGGFEVRKPEFRQLAEHFAAEPDIQELQAQADDANQFASSDAQEHYRRGLELYGDGQVDAALAEWRAGVALEPENWIIRKQIWAIENPDRFYAGDVDFDWQREQIAQDR